MRRFLDALDRAIATPSWTGLALLVAGYPLWVALCIVLMTASWGREIRSQWWDLRRAGGSR